MSARKNAVGAYRRDIDGLRGIAVLSVIIYHAFPKFIRGGFIGVDVFFVISGFLISEIILREESAGLFSYVGFYARRAKRLFPALIVVLAASLLAGWFILWSTEYKALGRGVAAGAGFVANLLLYAESGYFDVSSSDKPLLHLWSLGVEEQFYLVWPTLLVFSSRARIFWLPAVLALGSFIFCVLSTKTSPDAAFYLPISRFWEFMLGFGVCYIYRSKKLVGIIRKRFWFGTVCFSLGDGLSVVGLGFLIYGYYITTPTLPFPGAIAGIPAAAAALLILSGESALINRWFLGMGWLVYVGLISYPLYLWHWPLISFEYLMDYGERSRGVSLGLLFLALFLSDLTWRFLERPTRASKHVRVPVILFILLALVGALGVIVGNKNGFPSRFYNEKTDELQKSKQLTWSLSGWVKSCPYGVDNSDGPEVVCEVLPARAASSRRIMLVGDSHAMAFAEALNEVRERSGIDFDGLIMAKGGCMPFAWVEKLDSRDDCHPFYASAYSYMTHESGIETVILLGRWASRFHGTGFGVDTKRHSFRDVRSAGQESQEELFASTLRETIQALHAAGKRIIFIHQVPELGFNIKSCLPRPISFKPVHECTIDRSIVESRQSGYRARVSEILSDYPGVIVFDPMDDFCDRHTCYARMDGNYLYTDNNHLSDLGARRLGDSLIGLLKN